MASILRSAFAGLLLISLCAGLAEGKTPTTRPSSRWVPPVNDAPARRVGGAARGCPEDPDLLVSLLAPAASVGQTVQSQPVLYWYISKPTDRPVEITITPCGKGGKDIGAAPILDAIIPRTTTAGIQALSLARPPANQPPVSLEVGVQYTWVVEAVVHDRDGADNPNATTRLERVMASASVAAIQSATLEDRYEAYRRLGIWYDMLQSVNQLIDTKKGDPAWREVRRELLSCQNLVEADDGKITEPVEQNWGAGKVSPRPLFH
jgi:hypothetical protein